MVEDHVVRDKLLSLKKTISFKEVTLSRKQGDHTISLVVDILEDDYESSLLKIQYATMTMEMSLLRALYGANEITKQVLIERTATLKNRYADLFRLLLTNDIGD